MRSEAWTMLAKVVIVAVSIPFIALNVWAYGPYVVHGLYDVLSIPFIVLAQLVPSNRWVTVIATDLMFGWALSSIIVVMVERSLGRSWFRVLLWVIPLNWIGNIVLALYLLLNLQHIRDRLFPASRPAASLS